MFVDQDPEDGKAGEGSGVVVNLGEGVLIYTM